MRDGTTARLKFKSKKKGKINKSAREKRLVLVLKIDCYKWIFIINLIKYMNNLMLNYLKILELRIKIEIIF